MKNTWNGIKSIISLKSKESESSKTILYKGKVLINPINIASSFNNLFCSVAPNIQSSIKQTVNPFHNYLTNPCNPFYHLALREIQDISNFKNWKTYAQKTRKFFITENLDFKKKNSTGHAIISLIDSYWKGSLITTSLSVESLLIY